MMKKIKVKFVNQWTSDNSPAPCSIIKDCIYRNFEVEIDDENPDYIISQGFLKESLGKYSDKVILFETGEAIVPDFNLVDYAIGYDPIIYNDRYIQFPYHYWFWNEKTKQLTMDQCLKKSKFCNFIYSNSKANPIRDKFFHFLNQYKKVDSYGKHLNNMEMPPTRGEPNWQQLKSKLLEEYKFTIAFENSNHSGYMTEKLSDAFDAQTIPIYFGDPNANNIFNKDSFIQIKSENDFSVALEKIKEIDLNEQKMLDIINKNKMNIDLSKRRKEVEKFIVKIFNQPVEYARKRPVGTFQNIMSEQDVKMHESLGLVRAHTKKSYRGKIGKIKRFFWGG